MSRIFISYRREDSDIWAGRLADELRKHFPAEQVFQDIASIDPGANFRTVLKEALATAAVMLVIIGPRWLSATDKNGRKRLESSADFVHQEVAESLRSPAVRVFPLLVNGAAMPVEEDLPDPLKPLVERNAVELTVRHWASDVAQLVQTIKRSPGVAEARAGEEVAPRSADQDTRRAAEARDSTPEAARLEETTPEFRSRPAAISTSAGSPQQGRKWGAPLIALAVFLVLGGAWIAYQRSQDNKRLQTERNAAEQRAAAEKTAAELTAALKAANERAATEQSKVAAEQAAAKKAEALRKVVTEQPARRVPAETADAGRVSTPPPQSSRDTVAQLNVGGRWRDNWGVVYTISQDGSAMRVVAEGPSCRGGYFRSTGSGKVTGNSFETTYQSTLPSRGECFGTISASGTRMTSTCRDTVCGQIASSVDRQ